MILRILTAEITLSAGVANTVSDASAVRILNDSGGDVLIQRQDASNNVIGSTTVPDNGVEIFIKNPTDQLESDGDVKAVSVAFTVS
jgi:hypothetical protein